MLERETIEFCIAIGIAITAIIVGAGLCLNKFGLLTFMRKEVKCNETENKEPCLAHSEVKAMLIQLKETQILNVQRHIQHERELQIGSSKFEHIRNDISDLREGVGILMDRSGGRPKEWRKP